MQSRSIAPRVAAERCVPYRLTLANMKVEQDNLPTVEYHGKHATVNPGSLGFETRLNAYAYTRADEKGTSRKQAFEVLQEGTIIFEPLIDNEKIRFELKNNYQITLILESANQKLSQLISIINFLSSQIEILNKEIQSNAERKYDLRQGKFYFLITNIESVFFLNSSILDLMCKFHSLYLKTIHSKTIPDKYGQQKAWDKVRNQFNIQFDSTLQDRQLKNNILNICHDYRNSFSHETCLSFVPLVEDDDVEVYVSKGNSYGLRLSSILQEIPKEQIEYITFYVNHLQTKFGT